jgi:hypothetical protein
VQEAERSNEQDQPTLEVVGEDRAALTPNLDAGGVTPAQLQLVNLEEGSSAEKERLDTLGQDPTNTAERAASMNRKLVPIPRAGAGAERTASAQRDHPTSKTDGENGLAGDPKYTGKQLTASVDHQAILKSS